MLWIKRNIFFFLSLVVAVGLFGWGCYYLYASLNENMEVQKNLEQTEADLKKIYDGAAIFPNATNIAILRQQDADLKQFIKQASQVRKRVDFDSKISPPNFKTLLDNTVAELNREAANARIAVAQKDFSFAAIKPLVNFAEGSVPVLAEQLGEIKAICGLLFRSEIGSLESIKREPISKDDAAANGSPDYHTFIRRTNDLTGDVSSFYLVTFQAFSETVASVIDNVQRAPEGISVKLLTTSQGLGMKGVLGGAPAQAGYQPAAQPQQTGTRGGPAQAGRPGAAAAVAPVRRLDTMASEKSFRVSMLLEVTKPAVAAATP